GGVAQRALWSASRDLAHAAEARWRRRGGAPQRRRAGQRAPPDAKGDVSTDVKSRLENKELVTRAKVSFCGRCARRGERPHCRWGAVTSRAGGPRTRRDGGCSDVRLAGSTRQTLVDRGGGHRRG